MTVVGYGVNDPVSVGDMIRVVYNRYGNQMPEFDPNTEHFVGVVVSSIPAYTGHNARITIKLSDGSYRSLLDGRILTLEPWE